MKVYLEITIKPQPEIPLYFLWEKVYQQIHLALVEMQDENGTVTIGVSFPEYDACQFQIGCKLRLLAEEKVELEKLAVDKWLSRLCDYVHVKPIVPVHEKIAGHVCFRHVKMKGSKEKFARRRAKRKGETLQQALSHFENFEEQRSKLPYINMTSQTNGQRFRLFIEKQVMEQPQIGSFSCYGLSNTTTVPLF
ncbi:MAG: type I-F CRISPR-associated endoribonuclease Cas6/Csy4 [Deltaproteobacteria bacterium]|nr:type I-F CRISPR-associated endoribonuclease Cas6/Csy4 [Deltaproteobacteria bacterium]